MEVTSASGESIAALGRASLQFPNGTREGKSFSRAVQRHPPGTLNSCPALHSSVVEAVEMSLGRDKGGILPGTGGGKQWAHANLPIAPAAGGN